MKNWKSILTTVLGLIGGALVALGVIDQETVNTITGAILAAAGGIATLVAFIIDMLSKDEGEEVAEKVVRKIEPMLKTK